MKRHKKLSDKWYILVPTIIGVIALASVFIVLFKLGILGKKTVPVVDDTPSEIAEYTPAKKEENLPKYIHETNYKGLLSDYLDLYDIPFGKSDAYIMNKDFAELNSGIFKECEDEATYFMESLFTVDYRDILADKDKYLANVMRYCDYVAPYTYDLGDEEKENTVMLYEHVSNIADYFIKNQVQMDAKFLTDDSLVYSDYYVFVRGELVFTMYSNNDSSLGYAAGQKYMIPMEVAFERFRNNSDNHVIVSFGEATDPTFFLNP